MATKQKQTTVLDTKINEIDGMTLVLIPPGEFMMGADPDDRMAAPNEKPAVKVLITKSYWLATTMVTQEMFEKIMKGVPNRSSIKNAKNPITSIKFSEAVKYCNKVGGRLPSEAEFEWAARAGTTNSRVKNVKKQEWFNKNSDGIPHSVAKLKPNDWGLYDILGNICELTCTPWEFELIGGTDPGVGNDSKSIERVTRGGSYGSAESVIRASSRGGIYEQEKPRDGSDFPGFRYVIPT